MQLNNRGMSLIEIMISLSLLAMVSLAMLQMGLVSMSENVRNSIRDETVNVAEMRLNQLRSLSFTDPTLNATTGTDDGSVARTVRSANVTFNRTRIITNVDSNTKLVTMTVSVAWQQNTKNYTHSITMLLKRS